MANKLTLKVKSLAFYDGHLVYPNEIIKNFKGDKVPSWATLAGGKEAGAKGNAEQKGEGEKKNQTPAAPQAPKKDEVKLDNVGQDETNTANDGAKEEVVLDNIGQGEEQNTGEENGQEAPQEKADCEQSAKGGSGELSTVGTFNAKKQVTEAELQAELDELLNESVALNIIIEDAENKTIAQQIEELKTLLGKK